MVASTTFCGPLSVHLACHFFPAFGPCFFDRIKELNDDEPWLEDPEDNKRNRSIPLSLLHCLFVLLFSNLFGEQQKS